MESLPFTFTMLKTFIITNVLVLFTVQESRQASNGKFLNIADLKLEFIAEPGDNVTLPCRFSTDNSMELTMLKISWSKDGKEMQTYSIDSNHSVLVELDKGNGDLPLRHIQRKDGGNYICNIKYRSLEEEVTRTVIVNDPAGHSSTVNSQNDIVSRLRSIPPSRDDIVSRLRSIPPSQNVKELSPPSPRKDVESSPTPSSKEPKGSPLNADDEFRTAKITMVTALLSVSWCLAFLIFYYLPKLN